MKKVIIILLVSICSLAQQKQLHKIDSLLVYLNQNDKFMGQISISEGSKIVFEKAYGFADTDKKTLANTETKYKIGAITKMFTSVMILQLVEEKKLQLEDKLAKFYPKIKNADKITISNLLHHRTGIFNITDDSDYVNFRTTESPKTSIVERLEKYDSLFEPNTKSEYSNSNYIILGFIVEDITKKKYAEVLNQKIVSPLRLKNTQFGSAINSNKNEAFSYTLENKTWLKKVEENWSLYQGAGAIQSTTADMTVFINALFAGKLFKKNSLDEMSRMEEGYGKGIFKMPFGDKILYGHNGGIESFRSILQYYPKDKCSIAIFQNGGAFDINDILIGILSIYYKMPYQFPNAVTFNVNPKILQSYQGIYVSSQIQLKITVKLQGDKLTAQATGQSPFPLNPVGEQEFVFDAARIRMYFDKKTMLLRQGGKEYTFSKE
jgi:CubicO group peptidase (beta-lactamase class C family)